MVADDTDEGMELELTTEATPLSKLEKKFKIVLILSSLSLIVSTVAIVLSLIGGGGAKPTPKSAPVEEGAVEEVVEGEGELSGVDLHLSKLEDAKKQAQRRLNKHQKTLIEHTAWLKKLKKTDKRLERAIANNNISKSQEMILRQEAAIQSLIQDMKKTMAPLVSFVPGALSWYREFEYQMNLLLEQSVKRAAEIKNMDEGTSISDEDITRRQRAAKEKTKQNDDAKNDDD